MGDLVKLDPAADVFEPEPTPSAQELRVKLLTALNTAIERRELKGTAIVQGLNAIAKLAELEARAEPEVVEHRDEVLELLTAAEALPPDAAAKVIGAEIARLEDMLGDYRELLTHYKGLARKAKGAAT